MRRPLFKTFYKYLKSLMKIWPARRLLPDPGTGCEGQFGSLCAYQNCNNISRVWTTVQRCDSFAFLAGAEPTSAANELAEGREVTNAQG
jgi:hypothetical protein